MSNEQHYPDSGFPRQHQEQPGQTSLMEPEPDHGEASYRGSGLLTGRRALITGGDSGIGRAVAIALAREGADVAITCLPDELADARDTVGRVEHASQLGHILPGDLRDEETNAQLVTDTVRELGGLDILVLNAGYQERRTGVENLATDELRRVVETNLYAPIWMTRAALPHLSEGASHVSGAVVPVTGGTPL